MFSKERKFVSILFGSLLVLSFCLVFSSVDVFANGTETLGTPSIGIASGSGIEAAGTGLQIQPATIDLNVPPGATINQVLLYWQGKGAPDDTINVDGNAITGTLIGGPSPVEDRTFRADITGIGLVSAGSNTLTVSGVNFGNENDGAGVLVIFDGGAEEATNLFSGRANVVNASLSTLGDVNLVDTGELPPDGGSLEEELVSLNVPGLLNSGTATAMTSGSGDESSSLARVENLNVTLLNLLTANVVESTTSAQCDENDMASVSGSSQIAGLTVLGTPINISGEPNQTFQVMVDLLTTVTIVINEQIASTNGAEGEITVNALHIMVTVLGIQTADIVVSSASSDIVCGGGAEEPAHDIQLVDGDDFAFFLSPSPSDTTVPQTFNFTPASFDRVADLKLFVGDARPDRTDVTEITVDGTTTRLVDILDSSDGIQWDTEDIPVEIPAGASSLTVQILSEEDPNSAIGENPDSLIWALAALSVPTEPARDIEFSGQATVVQASVLSTLLDLTLVNAGPLPPSGGSDEETLASLNVPGLLTSGTASASTVGMGNQSNSQATVEGLSLTLLELLNVNATVIDSMTTAQCDGGIASVSGDSIITDLSINGINIDITGEPNQTIDLGLLGVTIIINEQNVIDPSGGISGDIEVTALHIIVADPLGDDLVIADVRISFSEADIICPSQ